MAEGNKKSGKIVHHLDKIIMGVIIGGAIISVIGKHLSKKKAEKQDRETIFLPKPEQPRRRGFFRRLFFGK